MQKSQPPCKLQCFGFACRVRGGGGVGGGPKWTATSWIIRQPPCAVWSEDLWAPPLGSLLKIHWPGPLGSLDSIGLMKSNLLLWSDRGANTCKYHMFGKGLWCASFNFPSNLSEQHGVADCKGSTTTTNHQISPPDPPNAKCNNKFPLNQNFDPSTVLPCRSPEAQ